MIPALALALWQFTAPPCPQYPAAIETTCAAGGPAGKLTICQRKAGSPTIDKPRRPRPGEIVCLTVEVQ